MPNFTTRSEQIEIMDDLNCHGKVVDQTLRELEAINKLLGGNYVTVNGVGKLLKNYKSLKPISIVDVGCGGGDILRLILAWGKKENIECDLVGIDANPNIIKFAAANSTSFPQIRYETIDIFSDEFKSKKVDIVVGTLFFHHFTSPQLTEFFKQVKDQASLGIVINDIHRHWLAYYLIKILTKIFSKSSMVKYDAPLSVLRAFRKNELVEIMQKAGIKNYSLRWMWAFRWQVLIHANA